MALGLGRDGGLRMPAAISPRRRAEPRWALAALSCLLGFLSVMPLIPQGRFPSFDSSAYIFVADGMLAGRIPYVELWENKGLPLYVVDILGRIVTPGSYVGIWLLELVSMSVVFGLVIWTLRRFVSVAAVAFAAGLLVLGIVMTSVGGNTPEFWNMALQSIGLLAAWILVRGEAPSQSRYMAFVGFAAGIAGMTKLNLLGTWIALLLLIGGLTVAKRQTVADSLRILGVMAAGFFVGIGLSVAPVVAWGATGAWWDQTIGFGLSFSSGDAANTRLSALLTGLNRIAFISWPLLLGLVAAPGAWLVGKRPKMEVERGWMYAFLLLWLSIELAASSASGMPYTHYSMPWLVPSAMLLGMLWDSRSWRHAVLILSAAVSLLGTVHVLPILDAKLNIHRGFPPVIVAESRYFKRAQTRMVEEVEWRTKPNDTVFMWGLDPVVFNETGRLSAGPYSHPLTTLLLPAYHSERRFDDLIRQLEADPPELIIDSTHIRDDMPSIWDLRTKVPFRVAQGQGQVMPYMHVLPDFVEAEYTLVATSWPQVEYYQLNEKRRP